MGVAYFIRGAGPRVKEGWAVIKLLGDREETVQDGLTLIAAEILCRMLLEDLPRRSAAGDPALPVEDIAKPHPRQLSLKF